MCIRDSLNIELILEDESGLKIPKSAVVEEQFYIVPEEYITTGGNSSSSGVMVQDLSLIHIWRGW